MLILLKVAAHTSLRCSHGSSYLLMIMLVIILIVVFILLLLKICSWVVVIVIRTFWMRTSKFWSRITTVSTLVGVWVTTNLIVVIAAIYISSTTVSQLRMQTLTIVRNSTVDALVGVVEAISLATLLSIPSVISFTIVNKRYSLPENKNNSLLVIHT